MALAQTAPGFHFEDICRSDPKERGYDEAQIAVALAHTDAKTTRIYLRGREVPVSEVLLKLPVKSEEILAEPANIRSPRGRGGRRK